MEKLSISADALRRFGANSERVKESVRRNCVKTEALAVKNFATTGEISNTFREVFGEYKPKEVF